MNRRWAPAGLALVLLSAACGTDDRDGTYPGTGANTPPPDTPAAEEGRIAEVSAVFVPYSDGATAVTYDEEAIPDGATIRLTAGGAQDGTEFALAIGGLAAGQEYGAQMHTGTCGASPDSAGPRYQNEKDPDQPSTSMKYANDSNEVWLDFTTDGDGSAHSTAVVDWEPRPKDMKSLVITTGHTEARTAGDPIGCVDVDIEPAD